MTDFCSAFILFICTPLSTEGKNNLILNTCSTVNFFCNDYEPNDLKDVITFNVRVMSAGQGSANSVYHNNGDGTFNSLNNAIAADLSNNNSNSWADIDHNVDMALVVDELTGTHNYSYQNRENGKHWSNSASTGSVFINSDPGTRIMVKDIITGQEVWQKHEIIKSNGFQPHSCNYHVYLDSGDAVTLELLIILWFSELQIRKQMYLLTSFFSYQFVPANP